ncbi:MAG: tetratricopeptide repeat protein [Bacteroidota bacterium]|nr:tetratricopeptide repeat protein [Bacteroidota bacterium]
MKSLLPFIIAFFVLVPESQLYCQSDSLKNELARATHDTTRCKLLSALIEQETIDEVWPVYNAQLKEISKKNLGKGSKELQRFFNHYYSYALNNSGYEAMQRGDSYEAIKYYNQALEIMKSNNDKNGMATELVNIGMIFRQEGNISKALEYYHNALRIQLETGDKNGMAASYNNIGYIFDSQGESANALNYYEKSLKLYQEINSKDGIATASANLGYIHSTQLDPACKENQEACRKASMIKAIEYLNRSVALREEINDPHGLASSLNILGGIYDEYGDPLCKSSVEECRKTSDKKALEYYQRALELRAQEGHTAGLAFSYSSLTKHFMNNGQPEKALEYGLKGLSISYELGDPERIKDAAFLLNQIYEKQHQYEKSLEMLKLSMQMNDSVLNAETKRNAIRKGFQIEYEKHAATDSIRNVAKISEERIRSEAAITQQRSYTYGGLIGFVLMLLVAVISFRAFRNKQRANLIITEQKALTEQQKVIIEYKQKEIIDSINYAKRLQEAILPPKEFIASHLPENFIIYQPKDLVAGDFYWSEYRNGNFFIAAADSTGHGVPGALVSVVCGNALNRAIKEFGLNIPGEILDKTRELVLETFERSSKEVKDGMDISLLCINMETKEVSWSGANNPLWYIFNNELKEIKPDKQPIGKTDSPNPFTTHRIVYEKGTQFYLFTDGLADQFGGPHGKKFKYKQLASLFISNSGLEQQEQSKQIFQTFTDWKGGLEQVDDVLLIGVRL